MTEPFSITNFSVAGKVAVVTGGSKGLGLAIAHGLAQQGAKVAVVARTPPEHADEAFQFFAADLINRESRAGLVDTIGEAMGEVDILVHCAGQQHREPAEHYPLDVVEEMYALHVVAGLDLAQQAARHMLTRKSGKIIFISSVLGFQGGYIVPGYSSAKHAMIGMVKALANEWAAHGVNVNAIAPGYMATDMIVPIMNDPQRGPAILGRIPAKRLGEPEELIGAVTFLASAAASYIHGHTLVVDGGWLSR